MNGFSRNAIWIIILCVCVFVISYVRIHSFDKEMVQVPTRKLTPNSPRNYRTHEEVILGSPLKIQANRHIDSKNEIMNEKLRKGNTDTKHVADKNQLQEQNSKTSTRFTNETNNILVGNLILGTGEYHLGHPTGTRKGSYSWSQYGQDRQIDQLLNQKRKGFFVEVGGYEGEIFSNTLFFERERNWTGLLVEADPDTYKRMVRKDRNCYMINACISNSTPNMTFLIADALSSAKETLTERHRQRIFREMKSKRVKNVTVKCQSLQSLMEAINQTRIDYFSLDVEGGELHILNSIDWEKLDIDVFTIETDQHRSEILEFMKSHGYKWIKTLIGDDVFRKVR